LALLDPDLYIVKVLDPDPYLYGINGYATLRESDQIILNPGGSGSGSGTLISPILAGSISETPKF